MQRAEACKVSLKNCSPWPIYSINSVDKPPLPPPPKKKYLATPPFLITAAQFHHELIPPLNPFPAHAHSHIVVSETVDMISSHS